MNWLCFARIIFICIFATACGGRIKDNDSRQLPLAKLGLSTSKPHLVVFGALWCKPCRHEIDDLNLINDKFKDRLIVTQFLVEGGKKGVRPEAGDKNAFTSPNNIKPRYSVNIDPEWSLFDTLSASAGRQLPLLATVRADGEVTQIVQRSLEFETELVPWVLAHVNGQDATFPVNHDRSGRTDSVKGDQLSVKGVSSLLINALRKSWQSALLIYGFSQDSMPFEKGLFDFSDEMKEPSSAEWLSETGCQLVIYLKKDGSLASHSGSCG